MCFKLSTPPVQMQDDMRKTINEKVKEAQREIKPGKGGSKGKSRKEPEGGKRKKDQACCIIGSFAEQDLYPRTTYLLTKSRMQLLCLIFLTLYTSPKPELCRRRCRLVLRRPHVAATHENVLAIFKKRY